MNGTSTTTATVPLKAAKPPPPGPAPVVAPPAPPTTKPVANGATSKGKKKTEPMDPATMYETVKSRIAALEEEEVHGEEEERRIGEDARKSVKGMTDSAIQAKYIDLFQDMKRVEREHAKEKQKLVKDKDAAKSQLTKANQSKTKLENLARELQKDNKRLREDTKRLTQSVEEAQEELVVIKSEMERRTERAKRAEKRFHDAPDIVVKVVARYRAELFFKISRKTKLMRLLNAWTERMDAPGSGLQFLFTHKGRGVEADETPEDVGIEDGDEILAVEIMDLTSPDVDEITPTIRTKLTKAWTDSPSEARKAVEDVFDSVVRARLGDVLQQYALRERHFEAIVRSKELEVLLARARAEEQHAVHESERARAAEAEALNATLRSQLEDTQSSQARLMDKLIACCKEPSGERTQRLFAFLREELEKRGTKMPTDAASTQGG